MVGERGHLACALRGTPYRMEMSRADKRSKWRWIVFHVWGPRTIAQGSNYGKAVTYREASAALLDAPKIDAMRAAGGSAGAGGQAT